MDNMQVYLGVWTNWSRGAVMGATLTTTREYGNLLIAFTAFFIPFVATRFWRICCFFLHRLHSTAEPRGPIHHQRQVLLRNASSMESALVTLFSLIKTWHARDHASMWTLLPLFGFTILVIAAFTVAGGFSSRISSGISDEVLINGDNCGIVVLNIGTDMDVVQAVSPYVSRAYTDAANYAQQCYSHNSDSMLGCDRFVVQELQTATTETNRSCPFPGDICRSNNTNMRLDTGYIDSNDHLGLNAPIADRIGYRYVLECAPLKTEEYVSYVDLGNVTWARYNYGPMMGGDIANRTFLNYTYEVEDLSYQYSTDYHGSIRGDFMLNSETLTSIDGKINTERSSFVPIPEVVRTDGDVTIIFLSGNGVTFYDPVDDDWYRATAKDRIMTSLINTGKHQTYHPVDAASPLGCVEQWQWCNSSYQDGNGCGPLASRMDALNGASRVFNISSEMAWQDDIPSSNTSTASSFIWSAVIGSIGDQDVTWAVQELKTSALASRSSSFSAIQYALPKYQWHLDVQGWWNTILAKTQANMVSAAIGSTDPILKNESLLPLNQYQQNLCYNQVRSTNYTSFSLFGLYFTYITGALIILVSFILEPIFGCLHNRAKYKQYEHLEWTTNETLQLHRLAHEGAGSKPWSGCTDSVPITLPEANLASLDIEDLTHPILAMPVEIEGEVAGGTRDDITNTLTALNVKGETIGGSTVVQVTETSEEPALTNHTGRDSPISTNGYETRNSLQSVLTAHSLSIHDVEDVGAHPSPSPPTPLLSECDEEQLRQ